MTYPTHPTYEELHEGCIAFAQTYDAPDVILGVMRGGMLNAVVLSHIYDHVPVVALDYGSKKGAGDNARLHSQALPSLDKAINRVLVVDDICDSGHTLAEIYKAYESRGFEVDSYVSYLKESSVFLRTDYTWKIPADAPWIIFPFEVI